MTRTVEDLLRAVEGDKISATCCNIRGPGHSPEDRSLTVTFDAKAPCGFVVNSHAGNAMEQCRDYVKKLLKFPEWEPHKSNKRVIAQYVYRDASGKPYLLVKRYEPKTFSQHHWDAGQWEKGKPKGPKVPYRLPELLKAVDQPVFVVEGEKCVEAVESLGLVATCNSEGAASDRETASKKWTTDLNPWFAGRVVYIIPDADEPGAQHVQFVSAQLVRVAKEVRIVDLDIEEGEDVADWVMGGGTAKELLELCAISPVIPSPAQSNFEEKLDPEVAEPIFDPWDSYVVPRFPLEVLPDAVHRYVIEQAELIGSDPSALAMACLAQAAGSLDHRFALRVMRHGNWWAHPRLWIVLVGDPSRKKTPVIRAGMVELEDHQTRVWDKYDQAYAEYKKAQEGWTKASSDPPPEEPERPARYVVASTTVEKLGEILGRSERGMLVKRDELSGWLGDMERYNKGGDRSFWLQAWDGGAFTVDRISRGETRIKNLSVSIIGGIQPQRLAELHGLSHTLTSDGLLQRFIPVMMGPSRFPVDAPTSEAEEGYRHLTRKWIGAEHARMILSDDALRIMTELRRHIHELEKVASGFAAGFQGFLGKLPGMAGTLALILHLAEDPQEQRLHAVSRKTIQDVRKLVLDFIIPHAMEFYRTADSFTDGDRLKSIASWIVTSQETTITSRDLTRNVSNMRGLGLEEIHQRLSPLVAGGWLEPDKPGPGNKRWHVKPAVQRQLEHRRQEEEKRKRMLAELMHGPRKPKGPAD